MIRLGLEVREIRNREGKQCERGQQARSRHVCARVSPVVAIVRGAVACFNSCVIRQTTVAAAIFDFSIRASSFNV